MQLDYFFQYDLSIIDQKVYRKTVEKYIDEYKKSSLNNDLESFLILTRDFQTKISQHFEAITELQTTYKEFSTTLNSTFSEEDKKAVIIDFIQALGTTDLKGDIKAFQRWFDADAATERYIKKVSVYERELKYLFDRLSHFLVQALKHEPELFNTKQWKSLALKANYLAAFYYDGDFRVKHYAFESLDKVLTEIPFESREKSLSTELMQFVVKFSQDTHQSIELQQDALSLLIKFSTTSFYSIANARLNKVGKDYFFIRAHIAKLVCIYQENFPEALEFIRKLSDDDSEYVRQNLAEFLLVNDHLDNLPILLRLMDKEKSSKVISSAILSLTEFKNFSNIENFDHFTARFLDLLNKQDTYGTRCALHVIPGVYQNLDQSQKTKWLYACQSAINKLRATTSNSKVRKWCSQALSNLWILSDNTRTSLANDIRSKLQKIPLSKRKKIKLPLLSELSNAELGRLLTVLCYNDFPLDVSRKGNTLRLTRWYKFKFRLWRSLYEFRNSTTDKRQAHFHMIGRVFYGDMSIPSAVLGEQTATKVPGEPLYEPSEDGPRNYLPLVDELISCLDQNWPITPLEIYSSDGITEVRPPKRLWSRFICRLKLSNSFEEFASLRNWNSKSQDKANTYIEAIRSLGFEVTYRDYTSESTLKENNHTSITDFFAMSFIPTLPAQWENLKNYFNSVYSNNLQHLLIFLSGLFALFFAKHAWLNIQVNKARKELPLSIGGWGTRGKSGTERLKAALFNAMGLSVISKTTGCEAMFLHGIAHGKLKEMFLFRPYDKATIWEQVNLLRLSTRLDADVFLWECMGLTPSYVHILQRHWMRDDFATITNTYPDHEDVQGPAGYDIPKVMVEFIPKNSTLITSEEVMYPILKHGADKLNTSCHPVTWIETGRVTDDILERFPYEEHPNNIALVARLAELMGINKDFALRSMADNVVLDLGVLKTYPESVIRNRTLQYVMGNSANERLGAMGNWTRMGFDKHDMQDDARTWVSTVINNRADRVPRSKVFAAMLVKDISADQHFLIGTNLDGFMKFLNEAWEEHYSAYSIWGNEEEQNTLEQTIKECEQKARNIRIPYQESIIIARATKMLEGIGISAKKENNLLDANVIKELLELHDKQHLVNEILPVVENWQTELQEYQELLNNLESDKEKSNTQFIEFLQRSLVSRVVVVHDSMTSGEEITNLMANNTPVGLQNRIMGLQNIKGTGLDLVYRWQAWELSHASAQKLFSKKQADVAEGLQELKSFKEYGVLSAAYITKVIKEVSESKIMQSELFQAELAEIEANLTLQMQASSGASDGASGQATVTKVDNKFYKVVINFIETSVDISDAVKRRKKADVIYEDLATMRISHSKAALELQDLTKRQKGGWLWKSIKNR